MGKIEVIFISGRSLFDTTVKIITNSKWSHVGIYMLGGIVDALMPVVRISPSDRYANCHFEIIGVTVPNLNAAYQEALNLIGTPYGLFTDCVNGSLYKLIGISRKGNGRRTVNCSEAVTRILRAGGLSILSDVPADCLTPKCLYEVLKQNSAMNNPRSFL